MKKRTMDKRTDTGQRNIGKSVMDGQIKVSGVWITEEQLKICHLSSKVGVTQWSGVALVQLRW